MMIKLSHFINHFLTNENGLNDHEQDYNILYIPDKQELEIRINTFVNPYTQDVSTVYQERLERFKAFEYVAAISADTPSKLGFMKIVMSIPIKKATDDVLTQIKDTIHSIYNEWKPNESLVCFKAMYNGAISYFEDEWWYPTRAVIMNNGEYKRYDFSDETKFDEKMWELVQGEYDQLEFSDSFSLISPNEFQNIWQTTEFDYNPKPF